MIHLNFGPGFSPVSTATERPAAAATYDPAAEYRRRLAARQATVRRVARWNHRINTGRRLMLFAVIGYVVFDPTEAQALIPLGIALVPLLFWQNAVLRRWRRASKAAAYYERGSMRGWKTAGSAAVSMAGAI